MDGIIVFAAKNLFIIVLLLFVATLFLIKASERKKLISLTLFSLPIAFVFAKLLSNFINSPRPFVVERIKPLVKVTADNGFPSDHALLVMTLAAVLFIYHKKFGILLAALAVLVGFGRVLAKAHHPIDIIGSAVIAVISVLVAKRILKFFGQ